MAVEAFEFTSIKAEHHMDKPLATAMQAQQEVSTVYQGESRIKQAVRVAIDKVYDGIFFPAITSGKASESRSLAHTRAVELMELLDHPIFTGPMESFFPYRDPILETDFFGMKAPNGLSLEAGMLKRDLRGANVAGAEGFGIVKVGSIPRRQYNGNQGEVLFYLPDSNSSINNYGLPGDDLEVTERRLRRNFRDQDGQLTPIHKPKQIMIANVVANKPSIEMGTAIDDQLEVARRLLPMFDGVEFNIGCQNCKGNLNLSKPQTFGALMSGAQDIFYGPANNDHKPFGVKLSMDLPNDWLEQDAVIACEMGANFITIGNTSRDQAIRASLSPNDVDRNKEGSIGGAAVHDKALAASHYLWKATGGAIPIFRSAGVGTAEQYWRAVTSGAADWVGMLTAVASKETSTPNLPAYILQDVAEAMRIAGIKNMAGFKELHGRDEPYPLAGRVERKKRTTMKSSEIVFEAK